MPSYTINTGLAKPNDLEEGWGIIHNANYDLIDSWAPVRIFACTLTEKPSTSLKVQVRGGSYKRVGGHQIYSVSDTILTLAPSGTVRIFCKISGITSAPNYPADESYIPIAVAFTGATSINALVDDRCPYLMTGFEVTSPLDFANDTAAAAGGVKIGELYHSAGQVMIRRS